MYNLLIKDLKLGVNPFFYLLPFITGALMLIPGWLYFIVLLYFCFITVPNILAGFKSQNDLIFSTMMPVRKKDIVKARVIMIVLLELLHIVTAVIYGIISTKLYPNMIYFFFRPTIGFWGLCFIMLAFFNIFLISMYYKTGYKYGAPLIVSTAAAIIFAAAAEWLAIKNSYIYDLFKGQGVDNMVTQLTILFAGIIVFVLFTAIAYNTAAKQFKKVDL